MQIAKLINNPKERCDSGDQPWSHVFSLGCFLNKGCRGKIFKRRCRYVRCRFSGLKLGSAMHLGSMFVFIRSALLPHFLQIVTVYATPFFQVPW